MSAWWLLLIVPGAASLGGLAVGMFARYAYERGYGDGHRAGWAGARER